MATDDTAAAEAVNSGKEGVGGVRLKREVGLVGGVSIVTGVIIGSGIFVSPVGVVENVHSVGLSLVVWFWCGLSATLLALCFAEIGTTIPKSGGEYAYVRETFGPLPAFLILWMNLVLLTPATVAASACIFATYVLKPAFPTCDVPDITIRLIAAVVILIVTAINVYGVKAATKIQIFFTASKLLALTIVVITGIYYLASGMTPNLDNVWEDSATDPGSIAIGILSGFWAFGGWNYLNFLTGELQRPERNLPMSIAIGMLITTFFYLLANLAYFAVLTPLEMLESTAVAVTFAEKSLGGFAVIMPLFVACSVFGAMNGQVLGNSRVYFQGACDGCLPQVVAMISYQRLTPAPSLLIIAILSIVFLCFFDVFVLINYYGFVSCLMIFGTLCGLLYLRIKRPDIVRPIKTPLALPVVMLIYVIMLIILTVYQKFMDSVIGMAIMATGLPVYLIFVKNSYPALQRKTEKFTVMLQKLLLIVEQDLEELKEN